MRGETEQKRGRRTLWVLNLFIALATTERSDWRSLWTRSPNGAFKYMNQTHGIPQGNDYTETELYSRTPLEVCGPQMKNSVGCLPRLDYQFF